jgi:hypothetical protein
MKLIITENQNKEVLKSMVKKIGWKTVSDLLGGPKVLAEVVFNNDPMEYLNVFNGLDVVRSEQDKEYILFRVSKGNNIMLLHESSTVLYVSYSKVKSFLESGFNMDNKSIRKLINVWMSKNHSEFVPSLFTSFDIRFPTMAWIDTVV